MPRVAVPKWDPRRSRWVAKIGEKDAKGRSRRVWFPPTIGNTQKLEALEYHIQYLAKRRGPVHLAEQDFKLVDLFGAYLVAAERRCESGRISASHFARLQSRLRIVAEFAVEGVALGERPAMSISPHDVERLIDDMLVEQYSPYYVDSLCASVAAAYNWGAKKVGTRPPLIAVNSIQGFAPPVLPRPPERFAEPPVAAAFLRHLRAHAAGFLSGEDWRGRPKVVTDYDRSRHHYARNLVLLVRVLMRTGARPKELCVLQWSDIKWDAGRTTAGSTYAKAVIPPDRWKMGRRTGERRTLYFSPGIRSALKREYESEAVRHPTHVFLHGGGRGGVGDRDPWEDGSVLAKTIRRHRRAFVEADRRKPIDAERTCERRIGVEDVGPNRVVNYLWRHTAASKLVMLGIDLATIAELLGTSVEMIERYYGHLLDGHLARAAELLATGKLQGRTSRRH